MTIELELESLSDYMFTSKNLFRYTKHIIDNKHNNNNNNNNKHNNNNNNNNKHNNKHNNNNNSNNSNNSNTSNNSNNSNKHYKDTIKQINKEQFYQPKQKDPLFWCFYILKYGFSKYEMEINNQYFVIEKQEKYKYVENFKIYKDKLKIHKIKPLTEIEDDLINKDSISIKTFFALCIIENINVLLVDNRKIYVNILDDSQQKHIIIKKNNISFIDLEVTNDKIQQFLNTYFIMNNFDSKLKSITSYKLDELLEIAKKLDIPLDKDKINKKYIYELIVQNF